MNVTKLKERMHGGNSMYYIGNPINPQEVDNQNDITSDHNYEGTNLFYNNNGGYFKITFNNCSHTHHTAENGTSRESMRLNRSDSTNYGNGKVDGNFETGIIPYVNTIFVEYLYESSNTNAGLYIYAKGEDDSDYTRIWSHVGAASNPSYGDYNHNTINVGMKNVQLKLQIARSSTSVHIFSFGINGHDCLNSILNTDFKEFEYVNGSSLNGDTLNISNDPYNIIKFKAWGADIQSMVINSELDGSSDTSDPTYQAYRYFPNKHSYLRFLKYNAGSDTTYDTCYPYLITNILANVQIRAEWGRTESATELQVYYREEGDSDWTKCTGSGPETHDKEDIQNTWWEIHKENIQLMIKPNEQSPGKNLWIFNLKIFGEPTSEEKYYVES